MLAAVQARQGGPAQRAAQQRPARQEPEAHSMPSMQTAPAGLRTHSPPVQVRPSPQAVPLGRAAQVHMLAAVQDRQAAGQAVAQQCPETQTLEAHSSPATQTSPRAFLTGGTQRLPMQVCPAGQAAALGWQAPAAVQVWVVRVVPAQVAAPQEVPAASRRQPPWPLQPL